MSTRQCLFVCVDARRLLRIADAAIRTSEAPTQRYRERPPKKSSKVQTYAFEVYTHVYISIMKANLQNHILAKNCLCAMFRVPTQPSGNPPTCWCGNSSQSHPSFERRGKHKNLKSSAVCGWNFRAPHKYKDYGLIRTYEANIRKANLYHHGYPVAVITYH